jgi:hypothetical protein
MAKPTDTPKVAQRPQDGPHEVLTRIKYRSHLPGERYIDPGAETPTFEHLDDTGYQLLLMKNIIRPVGAGAAAPEGQEG